MADSLRKTSSRFFLRPCGRKKQSAQSQGLARTEFAPENSFTRVSREGKGSCEFAFFVRFLPATIPGGGTNHLPTNETLADTARAAETVRFSGLMSLETLGETRDPPVSFGAKPLIERES